MKILLAGLWLFLFAICTAAQVSSAPPDVTVLQNKWRVDVYNPELHKDPLAPSKSRQQEESDQQGDTAASENRVRQGGTALPPVVRQSAPETGSSRLTVTYLYEIKVRNTGQKQIRLLTWEYVFFEPGTKQEVGRRHFISRVSLGPGATRQLVVRSRSSPTGTIDATKAGKKERDQYSEQVVILSIGYTDGSVWRAASN
jgi:hypothetical protein